jgi:hypothetical protein
LDNPCKSPDSSPECAPALSRENAGADCLCARVRLLVATTFFGPAAFLPTGFLGAGFFLASFFFGVAFLLMVFFAFAGRFLDLFLVAIRAV